MGYLLVALLGCITGLRTLTPIAVLCWFAYLHAFPLTGWRSFAAYLVSVIIFTLLANGEYFGDKLASTPSRLAPLGLGGRIVFGAALGLILAQPMLLNAVGSMLVGGVAAFLGSHAGYRGRSSLVAQTNAPDWTIAVGEDLLAIIFSIVLFNAVAGRAALYLGNAGSLVR